MRELAGKYGIEYCKKRPMRCAPQRSFPGGSAASAQGGIPFGADLQFRSVPPDGGLFWKNPGVRLLLSGALRSAGAKRHSGGNAHRTRPGSGAAGVLQPKGRLFLWNFCGWIYCSKPPPSAACRAGTARALETKAFSELPRVCWKTCPRASVPGTMHGWRSFLLTSAPICGKGFCIKTGEISFRLYRRRSAKHQNGRARKL